VRLLSSRQGSVDAQRARHAVHEHGPPRRHVPIRRQQRCAKRAHRAGHAYPPIPLERGSSVDGGGPREHPSRDRRHNACRRPRAEVRDRDGVPGMARRGDGDEFGAGGRHDQGNRKVHEQGMKFADQSH
jgi:hypothetical protein